MRLKRSIPNCITALRIVFTPVLVLCIIKDRLLISLCIFAVVLLSDVFDGALARALMVCNKFGAKFDVIADLIYVFSTLLALNITGLAPIWFTIIVSIKFGEFSTTSALLKRRTQISDTWVFDIIGRAFAVLIMLAPGLFCLSAYNDRFEHYIFFLPIAACTLGMVSSVGRVGQCIKTNNQKNTSKVLKLSAAD